MTSNTATDAERARRADALIARMKEARGYIYPEWELAARQDPEFVGAWLAGIAHRLRRLHRSRRRRTRLRRGLPRRLGTIRSTGEDRSGGFESTQAL